MIYIHLLHNMIKGGKIGMVENLFLLTKPGFQVFYLLQNKNFYFECRRLNIIVVVDCFADASLPSPSASS